MKRISVIVLCIVALSVMTMQAGYGYINVSGSPGAAVTEVQNAFAKYQSQADFARGMANSSAYSSQAVTQRGYAGYDTFAVTVGGMVGFQSSGTSVDSFNRIGSELRDRGDAEIGVAVNMPTVQVSWHATPLMDDLYIGVKFGYIDYTYSNWQFNVLTVGMPVSYQLIGNFRLPTGIILWRGLSINSGLFYQTNKIEYLFSQGNYTGGGAYLINPEFTITAKTSSWVIPIEVSTAIRLLWVLNITAGIGVDFVFGKSELSYSGDPIVYNAAGTVQIGQLFISGKETGETPKTFMPKLVAGIGFSFGPVIIDVPVTYYYLDKGFSAGITVGFMW